MKTTIFLSLFLSICGYILPAQSDTTVVQIIEFSDGLDNRRAWRFLPPDTGSYRKILMSHTLKCDPALINNPTGSGCGEWDAGANFTLYQHFHRDSLRYRQGLSYPDTIWYSNDTTFKTSTTTQYFIVYDSTITEDTDTIGTGTSTITNTFMSFNRSGHSQYLFKASELQGAGLTAGNIDKLKLDFLFQGVALDGLTIRMKHTTLDSLVPTAFEMGGFQTVYALNTAPGGGLHTFDLTNPFNWDGSSNIVVDFSFTNSNGMTNHVLNGTVTSFPSGVFATADDGYLEFDGPDYIDVDTMIGTALDSFVTVSFWSYGDENSLPSNGNMINGSAPINGDRHKFLVRLPWGNGNIQWYAGYDTGTDNISKPADSAQQYEGKWNHWAFTKNAATGDMKAYLNGQLFNSGTGKVKLLDGINKFRIGNSSRTGENLPWYGKLNEFRLWNVELDSATIVDWMLKDLTPLHPNFSNLTVHYNFDGFNGITVPDGAGNFDGTMFGLPAAKYLEGQDLLRNMNGVSTRPNIHFVQGTYQSHLDSIVTVDSVANDPITLVISHLERDVTKIGLQDVEDDTIVVWPNGLNAFYNYYDDGDIRPQKYITPYGNYLNLGDGWQYLYDLTDYEPLLHDTIDFQGGDQRELIDLKFYFISGTPPRDVHSVTKLFDGQSGNYAYMVQNPKNDSLRPSQASDEYGIRYMATGHKFNNATNCAEFCKRTHYFKIDGVRMHEWDPWTECSTIPLFPQGGTWIYDRAGWCPGHPADVGLIDVTGYMTPGTAHEILYSVDADPTGTEYGDWNTETHFIQYSAPNHALDAEIYDIVAPNDWEWYGRTNPTCMEPVVILRNTGSTQLTSATITYGVKGAPTQTYTWNDTLDFLDTAWVKLPVTLGTLWEQSSDTVFEVSVSMPNGSADQYGDNDAHRSTFDRPIEYTQALVIRCQTNNQGSETEYRIWDDQGNIVFQRIWLASNDIYSDTVYLPDGCYVFELDDSDDDGLYFFNNNDGTGFCRIYGADGTLYQNFPADFGRFIRHGFTSKGVVNREDELQRSFSVFPNPASNKIFLSRQMPSVRLLDCRGRVLWSGSNVSNIVVDEYPDAVYILEAKENSGDVYRRKFVKTSR